MDAGQFSAQPEAMRSAVGNVGGIVLQALGAMRDMEATTVPTSSFANIGATVSAVNSELHQTQLTALRSLLSLVQEINDHVRQSADGYSSADDAAAESYGGRAGHGTGNTAASGNQDTGTQDTGRTPWGLWSSDNSETLFQRARADGVGGRGEPGSVSNVLGYLTDSGVGNTGGEPVPEHGSASGFADWLDSNADHQVQTGVINVYSGLVRDFNDIPGGLHNGDVVVVGSGENSGPDVIGVAAHNGQLYNHGPVDPGFGTTTTVRVYRPIPG